MTTQLTLREWGPLLVTLGLFVAVEAAMYVAVSRAWADLAGLVYLAVAPAVFHLSKRALAAESPTRREEPARHAG